MKIITPILLKILLLTLAFQVKANENCDAHQKKEGYTRCDILMESKSLADQSVPLFIFQSNRLNRDQNVEVILFLHGRGYSRDIGSQDSMLDTIGPKEIFDTFGDQIVFIAPQDIFIHQDTNSKGQDYWIGKEGRDWRSFLGRELPEKMTELLAAQGIYSYEFKKVTGVSMGAHGALSLGHYFPGQYEQVVALSPIFRPVKEEMPQGDYDVFLEENPYGEPIEVRDGVNMGDLALKDRFQLAPKTYIATSKTDFGIDPNKYPKAVEVWDKLNLQRNDNHFIEFSENPHGHSMKYWREALPEALRFMSR